jgi:hypothetical protein
VLQYADVQPSIKSVVTVDSPLMGIGPNRESFWLSYEGLSYCNSMDQLVPRSLTRAATAARLRSGVQQLLNRGISVTTIINDADNLFSVTGNSGDQGINGVAVNVEGSWTDGGLTNHNAVLTTSDEVATILQNIR